MAFRSQKAARVAGLTVLVLALPLAGRAQLSYEVFHDHWRKHCTGTLVIDEQGVTFQETAKKKDQKPEDLHHGRWAWQDIQQLYVSPKKIVLLTYQDREWLLGADRDWEFSLEGDRTFADAYQLLKDRLDQRFVAALADSSVPALWEIPAKLQGRMVGSEGVLRVGQDRIVFETKKPSHSRTWRYQDIENISSTGPFQLTLTTYERAKTHYGSLKGFNFQLKQPLEEKRFNLLWRRLNQSKGLEFLTSLQGKDIRP